MLMRSAYLVEHTNYTDVYRAHGYLPQPKCYSCQGQLDQLLVLNA